MGNAGHGRAIVVGYRGQDGSLLCQQLISAGVHVIGVGVDSVYQSHPEVVDYPGQVNINCLHEVVDLVYRFQPDQVYYLAAFHHSSQDSVVLPAWEFYQKCHAVHVLGLLNFLEAIRTVSVHSRLFYASSSLIFNDDEQVLLTEKTPYSPSGFYALTKVSGMHLCREYREQYKLFASTGILFNHESALRSPKFLSQKIIRAAIRISQGNHEKLVVGDLSARVDWGYAPDYVNAFRHILSCDSSEDFIVASGQAHSVKEFIEIAFDYFGLDWQAYVIEDNAILSRRPLVKVGDATRLQQLTGWRYTKSFEETVRQLIVDTMLSLEH